MADKTWRPAQGQPLNAPNDPLGVSFGPDGPSIGPIALLHMAGGVIAVRPADELEYVLGLAFDRPFDVDRYAPALAGVARALNAGDLGQAMLRVQLMGLPVLPDNEALRRATEAQDLLKASPDDPKHPGYPKGAPDSRGGQFRPKGGLVGEDAEALVAKRLKSLVARRAFRAGLRRILTWRAGLRFAGEVVSNVDPLGPAEVGDALMVEQGVETLAQVAEIKTEAEAAAEFVQKGPWNIEDLYVSEKPESFDTFNEFKKFDADEDDLEKRFGAAKPGYAYHHLAEQGANGRTLPPHELNSTTNIVQIPELIHEEINAEYARMRDINGIRQSIRTSLSSKPFLEHQNAGIELMRNMGIIK